MTSIVPTHTWSKTLSSGDIITITYGLNDKEMLVSEAHRQSDGATAVGYGGTPSKIIPILAQAARKAGNYSATHMISLSFGLVALSSREAQEIDAIIAKVKASAKDIVPSDAVLANRYRSLRDNVLGYEERSYNEQQVNFDRYDTGYHANPGTDSALDAARKSLAMFEASYPVIVAAVHESDRLAAEAKKPTEADLERWAWN